MLQALEGSQAVARTIESRCSRPTSEKNVRRVAKKKEKDE